MTYRIGECGGSFTTPSGILTSPLYPDYYPKDADCVYTISQPKSTFLTLTLDKFELYDVYEVLLYNHQYLTCNFLGR